MDKDSNLLLRHCHESSDLQKERHYACAVYLNFALFGIQHLREGGAEELLSFCFVDEMSKMRGVSSGRGGTRSEKSTWTPKNYAPTNEKVPSFNVVSRQLQQTGL